jgi:hypothetical protein
MIRFGVLCSVLGNRKLIEYGQESYMLDGPMCVYTYIHEIIFTFIIDCDIGIATGYGRSSIPGRRTIFLYFTVSRPALGRTQLPIQWVLFPRG